MKTTLRTLFSILLIGIYFLSNSTPTQPTLADRFFFRQLNKIEEVESPGLRFQDQTGFGAEPSAALQDSATSFFNNTGYHVFDLGLYYIHSYTIDKAQKLINSKIKELNSQYDKYILFGYGLGENGLNHQAYVKWGSDADEISIENKNDFVFALGQEMIGRSRDSGPSANSIDDTEQWAISQISKFFNLDRDYLSMALPEDAAGGLNANQLVRSSGNDVEKTILGIRLTRDAMLLSPSGVPIFLPDGTLVSFKHAKIYDELIIPGCIIKFILPNGRTHTAKATKSDDSPPVPQKFAKFRNDVDGTQYAYTRPLISTQYYHPIILGDEVTSTEDNCSTTYLNRIYFKPNWADKNGVHTGEFIDQLEDAGIIREGIGLSDSNSDLPEMRFCLPSHTAKDIDTAQVQVYNPYNMGGVRIKSIKDDIPTFFYGFYDYDEPNVIHYLYWNAESLTWHKFNPAYENEFVFDFFQLMGELGISFKDFLVNAWNSFKTGDFDYHLALDLVGVIPIVGEVADIANGIMYALEGDQFNAIISLGAAIPGTGAGVFVAKRLKPYIKNVWNASKKIKLLKFKKVCNLGGLDEDDSSNRSSSGCVWVMKNLDPKALLKKANSIKPPLGDNVIKQLQRELYKGKTDDFAKYMCANPNAINAWNKLKNFPNVSRDVDMLKSLTKALDNPKLAGPPVNIGSRVKDWVKKSHLKCKTCVNGQKPYLDEVLDNLNYFSPHIGKPGAMKVIDNIGTSRNSAEGANWLMKLVKENGINPSAFEEIVTDGRRFTADIVIDNGANVKYIECKSWESSMRNLFVNGNTNFGAQLTNYLHNPYIVNISQIGFQFNLSKWIPSPADLNAALKKNIELFELDNWEKYRTMFGFTDDLVSYGNMNDLIDYITNIRFDNIINPPL